MRSMILSRSHPTRRVALVHHGFPLRSARCGGVVILGPQRSPPFSRFLSCGCCTTHAPQRKDLLASCGLPATTARTQQRMHGLNTVPPQPPQREALLRIRSLGTRIERCSQSGEKVCERIGKCRSLTIAETEPRATPAFFAICRYESPSAASSFTRSTWCRDNIEVHPRGKAPGRW